MRNILIALKHWFPLRNSLTLAVCLLACYVTPAVAQDNEGEQLLDRAQASMRAVSGFHVETEISFQDHKALLRADIAGNDYDISLLGKNGIEVRGVGQKYWKSYDSGKTWQTTDSSNAKELFDLLVAPIYGGHVRAIMAGRVESDSGQKLPGGPRYVVTQQQSEAGKTIALLELLLPNDSPSEGQHIRYWVAQSKGKTWIERSATPTVFLSSFVFMDSQYSKVGEISRIDPPPTN